MVNKIPDFNQSDPDNDNNNLAFRFYDEFRCCIVHEGRIKNVGQFSYDYNSIIKLIDDKNHHIMIVNPKYLLISLHKIFNNYIFDLQNDEDQFKKFQIKIKEDFLDDFEYSKANNGGIM